MYEVEVQATSRLQYQDEYEIGVIVDYDIVNESVKIMDHNTNQSNRYSVYWGVKDDLRPKLQFKPNISYEINEVGEAVIHNANMSGFFGENETSEEYPLDNILLGWYGSYMEYSYDLGYEQGYEFGVDEVENGAGAEKIFPEMWSSFDFFVDGWEYGYFIATGVRIDYFPDDNGSFFVDGVDNYYVEGYERGYQVGATDAYESGFAIDENSVSEDIRLDFAEGWSDGYYDGYSRANEYYLDGVEEGYKVGYEEGRDDATRRRTYDATFGYGDPTDDILILIYRDGWNSEYANGYEVGDTVYVTGYGNSNSWSSGNYTRYFNNQYMEITKIVDTGADSQFILMV